LKKLEFVRVPFVTTMVGVAEPVVESPEPEGEALSDPDTDAGGGGAGLGLSGVPVSAGEVAGAGDVAPFCLLTCGAWCEAATCSVKSRHSNAQMLGQCRLGLAIFACVLSRRIGWEVVGLEFNETARSRRMAEVHRP
jgi:hypothetical protein